jgi:transposase
MPQCSGYSRFVFNYALALYNQIDHNEIVEPLSVDLGVKTFAVLSDGTTIESSMPYKKAKIKLGKF